MGVTFDNVEKIFVFDFGHDGTEDIELSIRSAVDSAHKKINLYHYDVVVMPKTRTKINQYMLRYIYRFNQPRLLKVEDVLSKQLDDDLLSRIRQQNVLVIEDVTTNGSTQNEILRTLRNLNKDNEITIFSLIGRKDLMAESL
ncbi:MAG: phosphoribosyltransferase [Prevotella sp.]|nr:phosphoribosyltransferase [Prevotella sp.]